MINLLVLVDFVLSSVIWFGFKYQYNRLYFLQLHLVKNHDIISVICL